MKPKPPTDVEHFAAAGLRALRRATREAHKVARMHGTLVYVWENGRVVGKRPKRERAK